MYELHYYLFQIQNKQIINTSLITKQKKTYINTSLFQLLHVLKFITREGQVILFGKQV